VSGHDGGGDALVMSRNQSGCTHVSGHARGGDALLMQRVDAKLCGEGLWRL
jgi:hypothetical protein